MKIFLLAFVLVLTACGSTAEPVTLDAVLTAFEKAGVELTSIDTAPEIKPEVPLPRSFREHARFVDTLLSDKGGQVFICDEPKHCEALQTYFEIWIGIAGPYTYTSPSGLVVIQLNKGFTPAQVARYIQAISDY